MLINLLGLSDPCPLIVDHILQVNANWYLPTDSTLIPIGEISSVNLTPFNFRKPKAVGEALKCTDNPDIILGGGVDHNFILNRERPDEMIFAGKLLNLLLKEAWKYILLNQECKFILLISMMGSKVTMVYNAL